jgi:tRNA(Ile)-lysidine synthase
MFSPEALAKILENLTKSKKIVVAYSGGLDSAVLLHALSNLRTQDPDLKISAIHINHSLSANAIKWTKHCQAVCKKLKIKLISKTIKAKLKPKSGLSQEAYARELRYQTFAKLLKVNDCLVTAHHADDQAETLLLQLFRGAGPKGLAAMPASAQLGQGFLLRPLLNFSRQELKAYAHKNGLEWNEDESNLDLNFDRNYIRHALLPGIKKHWPGVLTTLARVARHSAESSILLEALAAADYAKVKGKEKNTLSVKKIKKLNAARQRNVLRFFLRQLNLTTPSEAKLEQILSNVIASRYDAMPLVTWTGGEVRRFKDHIYALPASSHQSKFKVRSWPDLGKPFKIASVGTLSCHNLTAKQQRALKNKITIKMRQGGEKIRLSKNGPSKNLKNLFQEWQVPTWERNNLPLLYWKKKLAVIPQVALSIEFKKKLQCQAQDFIFTKETKL